MIEFDKLIIASDRTSKKRKVNMKMNSHNGSG